MEATKYVVIENNGSDMFCICTTNDYERAVGKAYLEAIGFIDMVFDNGAGATLHKLTRLEAGNGDVISITWEEKGKLLHRDYLILENYEYGKET